MQQMEIKYRRLDTIADLPGNAKLHSGDIQDSISEFGFIDVLGVNPETMHNLDGNGRLAALKTMYVAGLPAPTHIQVRKEKVDGKPVNVWYVPTVDLAFDVETEPIVAMRLNRSHDRGGYDEQKVFAVLEQAAAFGRLEQTGYDQSLFEILALKYAPEPDFDAPEPNGTGNSYSDNGSSQGERPTTSPGAPSQQPAQPLAPSYVRMVQLFLNADTHPVFLERCQKLIQAGRVLRDDGQPIDNLTDLIFALVRDADLKDPENTF